MASYNLSKPVVFGGLPAMVDPYYGPYVGDLQFSADDVGGRPTTLILAAPAKVVSVVLSTPDIPLLVLLGRPASQIQELVGIYAEFLDASGQVVGTQRISDTPGLSTRGLTLQAYYSDNGQIDPYFNGPETLRVMQPIKSVKLYAPPGVRIIYSYDVGVQYVYQEPEPSPLPIVSSTPRPSDPPKNAPLPTPTIATPASTPPARTPLPASFPVVEYKVTMRITVKKPTVSILSHLLDEAKAQIANTYVAFVDDERENKLLLNFGSDYQKVIVNKKISILDPSKLVVKLLSPLEPFVSIGQPVFISREVAKTTIDKIKIEVPPLLNPNPWLRPRIRHDRF